MYAVRPGSKPASRAGTARVEAVVAPATWTRRPCDLPDRRGPSRSTATDWHARPEPSERYLACVQADVPRPGLAMHVSRIVAREQWSRTDPASRVPSGPRRPSRAGVGDGLARVGPPNPSPPAAPDRRRSRPPRADHAAGPAGRGVRRAPSSRASHGVGRDRVRSVTRSLEGPAGRIRVASGANEGHSEGSRHPSHPSHPSQSDESSSCFFGLAPARDGSGLPLEVVAIRVFGSCLEQAGPHPTWRPESVTPGRL